MDLEIDLTPGASLASEVFAWIDTNGDGQISDTEGEAYARQMLRSVVLSVDDRPAPIGLVDSRFPPFQDMRLGVGTIRLRATANVSPADVGRHSVSYSNTHRSGQSVYLINALVPADPRIQIAGQRRDRAQHGLTLDYEIMASARWAGTDWLFAVLAMAAVLGATRWPRTRGLYPLKKDHVAQVKKDHVAQVRKDHVAQVKKDHVTQVKKDHVAQVKKDHVAQVRKDHVAQGFSPAPARVAQP